MKIIYGFVFVLGTLFFFLFIFSSFPDPYQKEILSGVIRLLLFMSPLRCMLMMDWRRERNDAIYHPNP